MDYARIVNGKVTEIIEASEEHIAGRQGTWVDVTGQNVQRGAAYANNTFTNPARDRSARRFELTPQEWIESWTHDEWRALKVFAQGDTNAARRVDQLLDTVKVSEKVDILSPRLNRLYNQLETNGVINAQRRAELTAGVKQ